MMTTSRDTARATVDWIRSGIVYEIYPRSFSRKGDLLSIEKKLPSLKKLGVTILWLMPIHPIGRWRRKGRLGSPYAVRDHYAVNPEYGTIDDAHSLVKAAHSLGFHIIMDLVLGHTSWDSVLMVSHPEWFKRSASGRSVSPKPEWGDVAALDYSRRGLRGYMIEMMKYWIATVGFDGFRCDDAGRVPLGFWEEARKQLDKIKPVLLISETDTRPSHHRKAFDLTYSSRLFRTMDAVLNHGASAEGIQQLVLAEERSYPRGSLLMRFSSNHDQNTINGTDTAMFGNAGARVATMLVNTLPGVPLLYNGQEIGSARRLSLFNKRPISWHNGNESLRMFRLLFTLRRRERALSSGRFVALNTTARRDAVAFARAEANECLVSACNCRRRKLSLEIDLSPLDCKSKRRTQVLGMAGNREFTRRSGVRSSMRISLPPLGWFILRMKRR